MGSVASAIVVMGCQHCSHRYADLSSLIRHRLITARPAPRMLELEPYCRRRAGVVVFGLAQQANQSILVSSFGELVADCKHIITSVSLCTGLPRGTAFSTVLTHCNAHAGCEHSRWAPLVA